MNDKAYRLRLWARQILTQASGDVAAALPHLDAQIIEADDAALERALTANYREYALRALLQTNLTDLEEEGLLPKRQADRPAPAQKTQAATWAHQRVRQMAERHETERRNYLDSFLVHGEPIGDLTPEAVLARADLHERDARFMRLMASGVPQGHRIREFVTPDEAAERWRLAHEPPAPAGEQQRHAALVRLLTLGRTLKEPEYLAAQARAEELQAQPDKTRMDNLELDCLARVMSEYEDSQR
jgi:hypothetical protein